MISDVVYVATFHATGCPNTHPFTEWWRSQSEETVVLDDMNTYCELTRDALASDEQRIQCCGAENCNVTKCAYLESSDDGFRSYSSEIMFSVIDK